MLKAALNRALGEGRVACSGLAWKQVSPFKNVAQTRVRFLPDDEARKLTAVCAPDFRRLVQADLYSGCRYSEATRLRVFDFESISATLLVAHSKSAKPRRIYLDCEAAAFFGYICKGKRGDELIFQQEDGSPFKKGSIKLLMTQAAKAAGIGPLTFHELRHTAASRWARLGLSLQEIAAQLGRCAVVEWLTNSRRSIIIAIGSVCSVSNSADKAKTTPRMNPFARHYREALNPAAASQAAPLDFA